ncbi:unnamed protein product, partial [Didymodactylos carnosus]
MINDYRDSVGKRGKWLSYSSTNEDRFGISHKELSLLSHYPDEEEVLLKA